MDQVAEGDRVVERLHYTGTHNGDFRGIPATGRQVSFDAIMISCIADGRIVEIFSLIDTMTLMRLLGVIPSPGA